MKRQPRDPKKRLIGSFFYWRVLFVGALVVVAVLGSVAWLNSLYENGAPVGMEHAIALNTLVWCEITYGFNCRFLHKSSLHWRIFVGNKVAWLCSSLVIALQFLLIYTPGLNSFFSMQALPAAGWGISIVLAITSFFIVELEKMLTKPLAPYIKPLVYHASKACCSWEWPRWRKYCACKCCDPEDDDISPEPKPKPLRKIPSRQKSGASLRYFDENLVRESV
jgi:hypothetical protein